MFKALKSAVHEIRVRHKCPRSFPLRMLERQYASGGCPESKLVSNRLVRRKLDHANPDYSRDPSEQDPLFAESSVVATAGHVLCHHVHRNRRPLFSTGTVSWFHDTAMAALAPIGGDCLLLRQPHAGGQDEAFRDEVDLIGGRRGAGWLTDAGEWRRPS